MENENSYPAYLSVTGYIYKFGDVLQEQSYPYYKLLDNKELEAECQRTYRIPLTVFSDPLPHAFRLGYDDIHKIIGSAWITRKPDGLYAQLSIPWSEASDFLFRMSEDQIIENTNMTLSVIGTMVDTIDGDPHYEEYGFGKVAFGRFQTGIIYNPDKAEFIDL